MLNEILAFSQPVGQDNFLYCLCICGNVGLGLLTQYFLTYDYKQEVG